MIRLILPLAALLAFAACSPGSSGSKNNSQVPVKSETEGGVDVGNMTSAQVPMTRALLSFPDSWSSSVDANRLLIQNKSGSLIVARKSEIVDLASPNAISLQQYLKVKFPGRDYKIINVNGLQGVRADILNSELQRRSDIYLISELKDFLHVETDLKKSDSGIEAGEQIISTVRVEYKGVPYPNTRSKTVTLPSYNFQTPDYRRAAYSMRDDCFSYVDKGCRGVSMLFANGGGTKLTIGNAGYDHGRIIELGPDSEVPFDAIKVDGKYLVAPISKVPLSDIYTAFTPKNPQQEQDSINLKEGYVYLIRTISWPEEDLIAKVRVDRVESGRFLTVTYTKLVYVDPKELQAQVGAINKYTIENEQPLATGEVTLFSRASWNNYYYASFNFEYSTSGNMFIARNGWDLEYGNGPGTFNVPHTASAFGQVIDVGQKDLADVTLSDYPDPNSFRPHSRAAAKVGHTYLIYHYNYDGGVVYGAVKVLELGPQGSWVRLKFRRVALDTADYFQKWIHLAVPKENQTVVLEADHDYAKSVFYPFINKRGDQGSHYYEDMNFLAGGQSRDYLAVDPRPYENRRGFYKLGKNIALESVTQVQIESLKGKFNRDYYIEKGDVIAVLLENYFDKTVMVMRVESYVPGKSVQLSMRYIYRAKTVYSDDAE